LAVFGWATPGTGVTMPVNVETRMAINSMRIVRVIGFFLYLFVASTGGSV
jgi:hypothetical protein